MCLDRRLVTATPFPSHGRFYAPIFIACRLRFRAMYGGAASLMQRSVKLTSQTRNNCVCIIPLFLIVDAKARVHDVQLCKGTSLHCIIISAYPFLLLQSGNFSSFFLQVSVERSMRIYQTTTFLHLLNSSLEGAQVEVVADAQRLHIALI